MNTNMIRKKQHYLFQYFIRFALVVIVFAVFSITETVTFADDWNHFGYDDQYTSYNPEETTITTGNVSQLKKKCLFPFTRHS